MKHLKKLGLVAATTLVATCGVVASASATAIDPASTAFTLTSTNSSWSVSGGTTFSCSHSAISGTTPAAGAATWKTIANTTLSWSGCTMSGFVNISVTPSEGCHTAATAPQLHLMGVNAATAIGVVTLSAGCSIDFFNPSIGCTWTITGAQTIGNGTAGAGGIDWTNTNPAIAHFNGVTIPSIVSNGVGFGCPSAGAHTGTLSALYTRSSATNVNVTP